MDYKEGLELRIDILRKTIMEKRNYIKPLLEEVESLTQSLYALEDILEGLENEN